VDDQPPLSSNLPRHAAAAHGCADLLSQSLFDNRLPRHEGKSQTIIQHGVASAGEQDIAAVGASNALTVRDGAMLQAGFIGDFFGRLRQFLVA